MADHTNDPSIRRSAGVTETPVSQTIRASGTAETLRTGGNSDYTSYSTTSMVDRRGGSGAGIAMIVLAVFLVVAVLFSVIDFNTFRGDTAGDGADEGATVSGATVETATGAGEPPVAIDTGAAGTEGGTEEGGLAPAAPDAATAPAGTPAE